MDVKSQILALLKRGVSKSNYRLVTGRLPEADLLLDLFTRWSTGVLHIGGHLGQESSWYDSLGKPVIWVEAMPEAVSSIQRAIARYPEQQVFGACLSDQDGKLVSFNVSSNDGGASSSLFEFGSASVGPESMWPELDLRMTHSINLETARLDSLVTEFAIPIGRYDHWIVDVQGSELLVLNGAQKSLRSCRSLVVEASSIDVYSGGAQWKDVKELLQAHGFVPLWECLGHMDVLFVRRDQAWNRKVIDS